jgi:hypothetical protein
MKKRDQEAAELFDIMSNDVATCPHIVDGKCCGGSLAGAGRDEINKVWVLKCNKCGRLVRGPELTKPRKRKRTGRGGRSIRR